MPACLIWWRQRCLFNLMTSQMSVLSDNVRDFELFKGINYSKEYGKLRLNMHSDLAVGPQPNWKCNRPIGRSARPRAKYRREVSFVDLHEFLRGRIAIAEFSKARLNIRSLRKIPKRCHSRKKSKGLRTLRFYLRLLKKKRPSKRSQKSYKKGLKRPHGSKNCNRPEDFFFEIFENFLDRILIRNFVPDVQPKNKNCGGANHTVLDSTRGQKRSKRVVEMGRVEERRLTLWVQIDGKWYFGYVVDVPEIDIHHGSCAYPIESQAIGSRPSAIGSRSSAICSRPSATCSRSSAICRGRRPSAVGRRPSAVGRRPPAVGRRPSAVGRRPPAVGRRPSAVGRRPSAVGRRRRSSVVAVCSRLFKVEVAKS